MKHLQQMTDIVAYARLNKHPKTFRGMGKIEDWAGKVVPCLEINEHGALCLVNAGMASFERADIVEWFACSQMDGIVLPPETNFIIQNTNMMMAMEKIAAVGKGKDFFNQLVINISLHRGKYYTEIFDLTKKHH